MFRRNIVLDNRDLNCLIIDTIIISKDEEAEFILKKLNEDVVLTETMKEAMELYSKKLKEM